MPGTRDPANPRRPACRVNARFGGDPGACFLLHHPEAAPAYRRLVTVSPSEPLGESGWWSRPAAARSAAPNERLRVLTLAEALRTERRYDRIAVALVAPAYEESIQRRWAEATSVLRFHRRPKSVVPPGRGGVRDQR